MKQVSTHELILADQTDFRHTRVTWTRSCYTFSGTLPGMGS